MVYTAHKLWSVLTLLVIAFASLLAGRPAAAQSTALCFPTVPALIDAYVTGVLVNHAWESTED